MTATAFLDEAVLEVQGGRGGNGVVSFLRTRRQPHGGPDGGNGGNGGSVFACADASLNSLTELISSRHYQAGQGKHGSGKRCQGADGQRLCLRMPVGTDIIDEASGTIHASLSFDSQEVLLVKGGQGGRGNHTFKSSTNQIPREATIGQQGDLRIFRLSLRLLADVGLLGLPNAGKSSFLGAISNAVSPVGGYPYTTLRPHLGAVELPDYSQLLVADIPGIASGAASGAGMGNRFLRHVSRTNLLLHMVDCSNGSQEQLAEQITTIDDELRQAGNADLLAKPQILVLTKSDLLPKQAATDLHNKYAGHPAYLSVHVISSKTGTGITELIACVQKALGGSQN